MRTLPVGLRPLLLTLAACCLLAGHRVADAQEAPPSLRARLVSDSESLLRLDHSTVSNTVLTLETSTNLLDWREAGVFHDALFGYTDLAASTPEAQFYRVQLTPRAAANDWKNQILFPGEPFCSADEGFGNWQSGQEIGWVKFAILRDDPTRVYFQDSKKYRFHYDFAQQRLPPFVGMGPSQFDAVSLYPTNQQVVLGAVLYPMDSLIMKWMNWEYGVQFLAMQPYAPEDIARWFTAVKRSIYATQAVQGYYMPTFEQQSAARAGAQALLARGVQVASIDRWFLADYCYAPGWAAGKLKYFAAADIKAVFDDGRLSANDILLTDAIPAEMPRVGGIISLTPATPNSHVALLSQTLGNPFAYVAGTSEQTRARALVGRTILLRVIPGQSEGGVKLIDLGATPDADLLARLQEMKRPHPLTISPKRVYGAFSADTAAMEPEDIQYFGGKAANYGLVIRASPHINDFVSNCVPAIAFSFDLWDAFLDQVLTNGQTLRAEIARRLVPSTNYPPDITSLSGVLKQIRGLFTESASFTPEQRQQILASLSRFDPKRKIRFRSSTNVEDSETFTGAGLYDSYSGCMLDDTDEDTAGPCQCDLTEEKERGVFRALQKVYASFYNDKAFLTRLAYGVDEKLVGMGVLVHHSFPDENELANGVAVLRPKPVYDPVKEVNNIELVTQIGAEPVNNPTGDSLAEIARMDEWTSEPARIIQYSSRLPIGVSVLTMPNDYAVLAALFRSIRGEFLKALPLKTNSVLSFEYKKDRNLGLIIKQVRELPQPATDGRDIFLINQPAVWAIAQKEWDVPMSNHRLKSLWTLHTPTMPLTASNLAAGLYSEATLQYHEDGSVRTLSGPLESWPNASRNSTTYSWTTGTGTNQRTWQLQTTLPSPDTGTPLPIVTHSDFPKKLVVTRPGSADLDVVELRPYTDEDEGAFQQRTLTSTNGVTIRTSFYWPKTGQYQVIPGYTASLHRFIETRILGLTSTPIVLTNYFSQTYVPGHHNQSEVFVFEPRLEPGLSMESLAPLRDLDIHLIHVEHVDPNLIQPGRTTFHVMGSNGEFRPF